MGSPAVSPARNYLDNAATSWPKPPTVAAAVQYALVELGAAAGRGGYREAAEADRIVQQLREAIAASLFRGAAPSGAADRVVLTHNGTAALNLAVSGLVASGFLRDAHVVTTAAEHNSVLRPLEAYAQRGDLQVTIVDTDAEGRVDSAAVIDAIGPTTKLVAVTHASNVTGAVQPVEAIGAALRANAEAPDGLLLCDAAQSWGYLPIDAGAMGIDLLAAPGHKGTLGPLGTGMLYLSERAQGHVGASIWGGTGGNSDQLQMPAGLPQRLEAGNLNVPALAGWLAGLRWLAAHPESLEHGRVLAESLDRGLTGIAGVRTIGRGNPLPVRSLVFEALPAAEVAAILDSEFGIQVRTGYHCAAAIHRCLKTPHEGTLRVSAGHLTSTEQVESAVSAIATVAAECSSINSNS